MKKIPLTQGKFAIVDDEDYPLLSRFRWRIVTEKREATEINPKAEYQKVARTINNRTVFMEYFIIPLDTQIAIFKNGNHFDFRKENLLPVRKNNLINMNRKHYLKKNSPFKSKYKNVTFRADLKYKPWHARITFNGKRIHIGSFGTEEEAALAYNIKAKELYGEFAYQNVIDDQNL